jgi:hypothetical protein
MIITAVSDAPAQTAPTILRCRALYDFERRNPNELSFKRHDIIRIFDRDPSGWWKGEIESTPDARYFGTWPYASAAPSGQPSGLIGLFPGTYCVLLGPDHQLKRLSTRSAPAIESIKKRLQETALPPLPPIPATFVVRKVLHDIIHPVAEIAR